MTHRIVAAGDSALIVEFEERIDPAVNARAIALAEAVHAAAFGGVRDIVPTYRSVAVYFDPLRTDVQGLLSRLEQEASRSSAVASATRAPLRIPVCYGGEFGPDLPGVAAFAKLTEDEVVRAHTDATYRVFMLGFVAGFAYLGIVPNRIAMPRRSTPRVRVPAGSVGIAGVQTGIYPAETPGGWQLVGRTPVKPFDLARADPFLVKAGAAVQFYAIERDEYERVQGSGFKVQGSGSDAGRIEEPRTRNPEPGTRNPEPLMSQIFVVKPGMLTTIQDEGRWGYQSRGVPVAGPMDPCSHRLANALVGNPRDAATLEITLLGPELEFMDERVIAVAGAEFDVSVDGRPARTNAAFLVAAQSRLRFGQRRRGARAYLAIAGGVAVPPLLGSRATHLVSGMGGFAGRPLRAGDRVPLGSPSASRLAARTPLEPPVALPDGHARLRVLPGPQLDYFAPDALDTLQSAPYTIEQHSDRMGFRLTGPPLSHARGADIISDATPLGVLQVPASRQPILLLADRQTAGGYPKIATVVTADLAVAGQLGPGDAIRFVVCTPREAVAALIAQERALMRVEESI